MKIRRRSLTGSGLSANGGVLLLAVAVAVTALVAVLAQLQID